MITLTQEQNEQLTQGLDQAGLGRLVGLDLRPGSRLLAATLEGEGRVLVSVGPSEDELTAARALAQHPVNATPLLHATEHVAFYEELPFQPLATDWTLVAFADAGRAMGQLHLEWKGQAPKLEACDAPWFSRATPFVLAEVASLAERGEYTLSLSQAAQLEEAGVVIAELAEPLAGLMPTLVHGQCSARNAGFMDGHFALADWTAAGAGLAWLDVAQLGFEALARGEAALQAFVRSYGQTAGYEPSLVGDLIPYCAGLSIVRRLDAVNRDLTSGRVPSGSQKDVGSQLVRTLL
ncbi:MAG TPA: hypothetical protein VHN99_00560, partial [Deinococcales bacterium]|nr:hypothetical protein [Deinococcales bacterium]